MKIIPALLLSFTRYSQRKKILKFFKNFSSRSVPSVPVFSNIQNNENQRVSNTFTPNSNLQLQHGFVSNEDMQLLLQAVMERMDQLERTMSVSISSIITVSAQKSLEQSTTVRFKVNQDILTNILTSYVHGNEWVLNNIKPLLSANRIVRFNLEH